MPKYRHVQQFPHDSFSMLDYTATCVLELAIVFINIHPVITRYRYNEVWI